MGDVRTDGVMVSGSPGVVHFVVPSTIDDPARPSGGNRYDRRVCGELAAAGWLVHEHNAAGAWPRPDVESLQRLADLLATIPDGSTVLVDGLIASNTPEAVVPSARRLRVVVVLHASLMEMSSPSSVAVARRREHAVLSAAHGIVTTSRWARERLLDRYPLPAGSVTVAEPGAESAETAIPSPDGGRLICVAAVAPHKGQDVVLEALAAVADLDWRCRFVGPLVNGFADGLRRFAVVAGVDERVEFCGPLDRANLDGVYATSDLLLHASQYETYGMVVTEALAHGVPVVATCVGGVREAMGLASDGRRPGWLVPPGDPAAFAGAIRGWLEHSEQRAELRAAALDRRQTLTPWATTAGQVAYALRAASENLEVSA